MIKVQFDIAQNLHLSQDSNFKSGPAIVTTWKGVSRDWAESWIKYHAAVGFTRLFIFWDDPKFDRENRRCWERVHRVRKASYQYCECTMKLLVYSTGT